MYQRDYILRLIEQTGQALIQLRNRILRRSASPGEVENALLSAARSTGLDLELARMATPETLQMLVAPTGEVEPGRCWVLAECLYLDGLSAELGDRWEDAALGFDGALRLYRLLEPGGAFLVGLPEAAERIEEILSRTARPEDPRHV